MVPPPLTTWTYRVIGVSRTGRRQTTHSEYPSGQPFLMLDVAYGMVALTGYLPTVSSRAVFSASAPSCS